MDVKFINPFVHGTVEAMKKLAFMDIKPGKVYLKESNVAAGDVSGIIGITGDATGSLAISFTETFLCSIVSGLTGERHTAADRKAFDVVREITGTILAVAATYIEKEGLKIHAAPPTVVCGKGHTIEPLSDSPSITIPFSAGKETFVVELCIKPTAPEAAKAAGERAAKVQTPDPAIKTTAADIKPAAENVLSEKDRKALLKTQLTEAVAARGELMKQLSEKPFMEMSQRIKIKKMIPVLDARIKRLKLDLAALDMIAKSGSEELGTLVITPHYQHYDNKKR